MSAGDTEQTGDAHEYHLGQQSWRHYSKPDRLIHETCNVALNDTHMTRSTTHSTCTGTEEHHTRTGDVTTLD